MGFPGWTGESNGPSDQITAYDALQAIGEHRLKSRDLADLLPRTETASNQPSCFLAHRLASRTATACLALAFRSLGVMFAAASAQHILTGIRGWMESLEGSLIGRQRDEQILADHRCRTRTGGGYR